VGNSTSITDYAANNLFIDQRKEFLRIKQVDFDGEYAMSPIIVVPNCESEEVRVSTLANVVEFMNPSNVRVKVKVFSMSGQLVRSMLLEDKEQIELEGGIYLYSYMNALNERVSGRILIVE
ncbi:MAG: hypothetical protein AB8B56_20205, partial [Crocinitomicaceae bacterium]